MHPRIPLGLLALLTLPAVTRAQTFIPIVKSGDSISGVGNVVIVSGIAVDNSGQVLVGVVTDNPNPALFGAIVDATHSPLLRFGDAVSQPPGATIAGFSGIIAMSGSGDPAFFLLLAGTAGPQDDEGIYVGIPPIQIVRETLPCTAPGIVAGSSFASVIAAKINNSQHISFHAIIDDPNITGTFDYPALFTLDISTGNQTLVAKRGDILPGQTWGIWNLEWDPLRLGFNNAGQVLFRAQTYDNPGVQNVIYLDNTLIAQTGHSSPFGGGYVSFGGIGLNNNGDYVFACGFNPSMNGIVQNGSAFVQSGDCLPSIEPYAISEVYEPQIADDGRVVWIGVWDKPGGGQGKGLFADYSLLVEQGETCINGVVVTNAITPGAFNRCLSPSGQYLAFKATLQDGTQGAYLIDLWQ